MAETNEDLLSALGAEEDLGNEVVTEEPLPEEDLGAGDDLGAEEGAIGEGGMTVSAEEMPELTGKQVGDTITMTVEEVTEDGQYVLSAAAEDIGLEGDILPEAGGELGVGEEGLGEAISAEEAGGEQAIQDELL